MAHKKCENCGKRFYAWRQTQRCCSHECRGLLERTEIEKRCLQCGNSFFVSKGREKTAKFCSRRCNALTPNVKRDKAKVKALTGRIPANKQSPQLKKAKDAFFDQRCMARSRGIDWNLSFNVWFDFWLISGHWHERGRQLGQYCMARFGDEGPYELGNIKICQVTENGQERIAMRGETNGNALLTEDEIREIRRLEGKMKRPAIAKKFGLNYHHVRDIQKRRCWKHVI